MAPVYHPGEIAVQARAGQRDTAALVGRSIRSTIPAAAQEFLRRQPMAIVGTVDAGGRPWVSMLTGDPGFIRAVDEHMVKINARSTPGDPLNENLAGGGEIGMIVIDFATRRRMRLNGRVDIQSDGAIRIQTRQVYSNCPKYIQARVWEKSTVESGQQSMVQRGPSLTHGQQHWINEADTFFIASSHPDGGVDASHRGGNPGFVRVLNGSRSSGLIIPAI